jgi:uncharacterized membrane protein
MFTCPKSSFALVRTTICRSRSYFFANSCCANTRTDETTVPIMSWPYAHLLINHFPVVLSISALVVTLGALLLKHRGLWLTAMGTLTAAGFVIYPVFFTGNEADHALNDPWYIHPGTIEAHDNAATMAMWVILFAGAFAAYSWWRSLKRPAEGIPGWMRGGVLVAALAAVGLVTYTAYLGGKIIHEAPVLQLKQPPPGLPAGIAAEKSDSTGD